MASAETILFEVEVQTDDTASQQLGEVDESVDSLEQSFQDLQQRSELAAQDLQNATVAGAEEASESMETLGATTSSTATNLSFELVQASQDAQFGMAGVANQIPLISQQFQRLRQQSGSTTGALSSLISTMTGPTGFLAAGTLLLQYGPQLIDFFQSFGQEVETSDEKFKELLQTLEQRSDVLSGLSGDLSSAKEDVKALKNAFEAISDDVDFGLGIFERSFQEQIDLLQSGRALGEQREIIERFQEALQGGGEEAENLRRAFRQAGVDVDTFLNQNVRESVDQFERARSLIRENAQALQDFQSDTADALAGTPSVVVDEIQSQADQVRRVQEELVRLGFQDGRKAAEEELQVLQGSIEEILRSDNFADEVSELSSEFDPLLARIRQLQSELRDTDLPDAPEVPEAPGVLDATDEEQQITFDAKIDPPDEEELDAFDRVLGDVQDRISNINSRPFLSGAAKAEKRVQAIAVRIREAQRAGAEFSRQEINDLIQGLDLVEDEADQVREVLSGDIETETADIFARGIARGAEQGFVKGLRPLFQRTENAFFEALQRALIRAAASAAAAKLAQVLGSAEDSGEGQGQDGGIFGLVVEGLLSAASSAVFDEGGYTGSGPRSAPAGVVHRGEYVMDAETTRRVGVPVLEAIQQGRMSVTAAQLEAMAGVPRFANGGLVGAVTQPSTSLGGSSSSSAELIREVRQLREEVRGQTERLENVERRVVVGRRESRDIVETGEAERSNKNPSG
jgi:hypothetical protein